MKYELHPACAVWPQMTDAELDDLSVDIKANGQRHPIVLLNNQVLDGRNRMLACERAGVTPVTEPYTGNDPIGFTVSMNLHRRQMTISQRAMVAAELANMRVGANQHKGGSALMQTLISMEKASEILGISSRSVAHARTVLESGDDDLIAAVKSGSIRVTPAAIKLTPTTPESNSGNRVEEIAKTYKRETGQWPTSAKLAEAAKINSRNADNALRTVKAVEAARTHPPQIPVYTKAQEKQIEAKKAVLEATFDERVNSEVEALFEQALLKRDKQDIEAIEQAHAVLRHEFLHRTHPFTAGEYTGVLLRALHPDTTTQENRMDAFKLVNNRKLLLREDGRIKLKSSFAAALPKTPAEWAAARAAVKEARRARRNSGE